MQHEHAVGMLNDELPVIFVVRVMKCSPWTIYHVRTRMHQTGSTSDRHRPGRPRVMSHAEDSQSRLRHMTSSIYDFNFN